VSDDLRAAVADAHRYLEEHNAGVAPNGRALSYARAVVTLAMLIGTDRLMAAARLQAEPPS
jgi:hypothetical protein